MNKKHTTAAIGTVLAGGAVAAAVAATAGLAAPAGAEQAAGGGSTKTLAESDAKRAKRAAVFPGGQSMPVYGSYLSAGWGDNSGPHAGRGHDGNDFAAPMGTPIYAAVAGKVVSAGWDGGYGQAVKVRDERGRYILYGHMSRMGVKKGQRVEAGQRIGSVGSTGNSTGAHLHFEVRNSRDRAIDPNKFLGASQSEVAKIARGAKRR